MTITDLTTATRGASEHLRPAQHFKSRLTDSRLAQFGALLIAALFLRFPVFGDWNFDIDDQFYALVGQRLLDGATLYVDIWDRKPPALYLTYALIAAISRAPLAWQLAATLAATAGAYGVCRVSRLLTGFTGALMAGLIYLVMLNRFGGATGQAAVFYNPLMIFAAWTIVTRIESLRDGWIDARIVVGMAAAGLAVMFKQSAAVECTFFGLYIMVRLASCLTATARMIFQIVILLLAGSLSTILTFMWFWHTGHVFELWDAIVTSNFTRLYTSRLDRMMRFLAVWGMLGMPLVFSVLVFPDLRQSAKTRERATFVALWSASAFLAVALFPNIRIHYLLPLVAPLCILSARFFGEHRAGRIGFAAIVITNLIYGGSWNLVQRWREHEALPQFERYVSAVSPHRKLLVFGNPSLLYARIGALPPSRLAFPPHFYEGGEAGASGMDEVAELRRVLDGGPETVVMVKPLRVFPFNTRNLGQMSRYLEYCRSSRDFALYDHEGPLKVTVHSGCRPPANPAHAAVRKDLS